MNMLSIKVIGTGGAGINAVGTMMDAGVTDIEFAVADTDPLSLNNSRADEKIHLKNDSASGKLIIKNSDEIKKACSKKNLIFIVAGLGGKTGTYALPEITSLCRESGTYLTIAVVSTPFSAEGKEKLHLAEKGLQAIMDKQTAIILLPGKKFEKDSDNNCSLVKLFKKTDNNICHFITGITDAYTKNGIVSLDFQDLRLLFSSGITFAGTLETVRSEKIVNAAKDVLSSPFLKNNDFSTAKAIFVNTIFRHIHIPDHEDKPYIDELHELNDYLIEISSRETEIFWTTTDDQTLGNKMRVTICINFLN